MNPFKLWRGLKEQSMFGANAALTALTNLALGGVGTVTGVLAARLLGPQRRGELVAIQTYPNLLGHITMLGTGAALIYFSARDSERTGRYIGTAALITLSASVPLIAAAYGLMPLFLSAQSMGIVAASRWYLISVPIAALLSLWLFALRGRSDFVGWNMLRTVPPLMWLVIVVFAWVW